MNYMCNAYNGHVVISSQSRQVTDALYFPYLHPMLNLLTATNWRHFQFIYINLTAQ